jgi:hypothetical protein
MRHLGDLLVWFALIGVLVAVIYFTPRFAQYMSSENLPENVASDRSLAWHTVLPPEQAE